MGYLTNEHWYAVCSNCATIWTSEGINDFPDEVECIRCYHMMPVTQCYIKRQDFGIEEQYQTLRYIFRMDLELGKTDTWLNDQYRNKKRAIREERYVLANYYHKVIKHYERTGYKINETRRYPQEL